MIIGTGLDLVELDRFRVFHERWQRRGLDRLFTAGELDDCLDRADALPSLAARFAAKEAFFKALGTGYGRGGAWTDVEVVRDDLGAPSLRLHGRAAACAAERHVSRSHLTLTHTHRSAGAVVILESG